MFDLAMISFDRAHILVVSTTRNSGLRRCLFSYYDNLEVMSIGIERRSIHVSGVAPFSRPVLALRGGLISISYEPSLITLKLIMISTWI